MNFKKPQDAREAGIETVYQQLAVIPALDIASNLYLAREERRTGPLGRCCGCSTRRAWSDRAGEAVQDLGIQTIQNMGQAVETLSGGQRQAVAVARAAAFGSKVVVLDEPTAALGVKESATVLDMIKQLRDKGLSIILISHNMPHVWEVADRIHIQRLGGRAGVITPQTHDMGEGVAIMTGAKRLGERRRRRPRRRSSSATSRRPRGSRPSSGRRTRPCTAARGWSWSTPGTTATTRTRRSPRPRTWTPSTPS